MSLGDVRMALEKASDHLRSNDGKRAGGRVKRRKRAVLAAAVLGLTIGTGAAHADVVETIATPHGGEFNNTPCLGPSPSFNGNSFLVGETGFITSIGLYPLDNFSDVFTVTLEVLEGDGLTGTVLGSQEATWTGAPSEAPTLQRVTLDTPIAVTAGQHYTFRVPLDCSDPIPANTPSFSVNNTNPYADGVYRTLVPEFGEGTQPLADMGFEIVIEDAVALCPPGTYSESGSPPCAPADPGHFVATEGQTEQTACPLGSFQPNAGASACLPAPIGSYVDTVAAVSATTCPEGTSTVAEGSTAQTDCEADFDGDGTPDSVDPDDDDDLVLDEDDVCDMTDLASDTPPRFLLSFRYWSDEDGNFGDSGYTVSDTAGCSASQVIDEAGLNPLHRILGISRWALRLWVQSN